MTTDLVDIKAKDTATQLKDFCLTKFKEYRNNSIEQFRTWMLNIAWTRGFQNVDYDPKLKQYIRTNEKNPWIVRLVTNLMLPIARRNVSQLSQSNPIWDVIPATADQKDIEISRTGSKILSHYWQVLDMPILLIRAAFWQSICSSGFIKVGWDKDKGDEVSLATKDIERQLLQRFLEIQGIASIPEYLDVQEGDLFADITPTFNMTVDDDASVFNSAKWCIESQFRSKDYVVDKYGNKYKTLTETSELDLYVFPFNTGITQKSLPKKGILLHEFWLKPTNKFKKGKHFIIAHDGTYVVSPEENPYKCKELPYAHYLEIYDVASLWGTNAVEQVRPVQARYNRINSAIMEHVNLTSNVQWLKPKQAGNVQITNRPGGIIEYNHPYVPTQVDPKALPAYVERMRDNCRLDIQDTASHHDVSEAKAEPGVRSGRAVLALQDADDSIKTPTLLWFDSATARVGKLALQILSQYVSEERTLEIVGEYSQIETITFNGEMLQGNKKNDYFKVRCKTFGRQALSRSARESLATTLVNLQLLNPVQHRDELLNLLGAADILSVFDEKSNDRSRQWKEIQAIKQGGQVKVYFGQDHDTHIRTIKKYIAGSEWDTLEDQVKELVSMHLRQHLEQQAIDVLYQQIFLQSMGVASGGTGQQTNTSTPGGGGGGKNTGAGQGANSTAGGTGQG